MARPARLFAAFGRESLPAPRDRRRYAATSFGALRAPRRTPGPRFVGLLNSSWRVLVQQRSCARRQLGQSGSYLNLAPPSAASYINPPLMIEKEATPFS